MDITEETLEKTFEKFDKVRSATHPAPVTILCPPEASQTAWEAHSSGISPVPPPAGTMRTPPMYGMVVAELPPPP